MIICLTMRFFTSPEYSGFVQNDIVEFDFEFLLISLINSKGRIEFTPKSSGVPRVFCILFRQVSGLHYPPE